MDISGVALPQKKKRINYRRPGFCARRRRPRQRPLSKRFRWLLAVHNRGILAAARNILCIISTQPLSNRRNVLPWEFGSLVWMPAAPFSALVRSFPQMEIEQSEVFGLAFAAAEGGWDDQERISQLISSNINILWKNQLKPLIYFAINAFSSVIFQSLPMNENIWILVSLL